MPMQPSSQSDPSQSSGPDGAALIEALANSDTPSVRHMLELWGAARTWLAHGGTVSLERCARLPNTPGAVRNAARNYWLRQAAELIAPGQVRYHQAQALEAALLAFTRKGPWPEWRTYQKPPTEASQLNQVLFYVAKHHGDGSLSARQIDRVLANK